MLMDRTAELQDVTIRLPPPPPPAFLAQSLAEVFSSRA